MKTLTSLNSPGTGNFALNSHEAQLEPAGVFRVGVYTALQQVVHPNNEVKQPMLKLANAIAMTVQAGLIFKF